MGQLVYDERDGYSYESDNGVMYTLLEGQSYRGKSTSDIIFVMLKYNSDLFDELDITGDDELACYFYGATSELLYVLNEVKEYVALYESKHPNIVNWFKKKKRITKPMPAELKEMLNKLGEITQCGGIRTYYDKEGREMADGGLDEYEYSDSTLVHNLMCCCEEVAYALSNEDIDRAEELIKIYAKELMEG